MKTTEYLNTLIDLILKQPKIGTILDENGFNPEITYGHIGVTTYDSLIHLYNLLNSLDGVKTTPIHTTHTGFEYDFTVTTPITLQFFYCK